LLRRLLRQRQHAEHLARVQEWLDGLTDAQVLDLLDGRQQWPPAVREVGEAVAARVNAMTDTELVEWHHREAP
jgi:hypothetical protein